MLFGLIPLVLHLESNWQCCGVFCCLQVYVIILNELEIEMYAHQPSIYRNFVQLIHQKWKQLRKLHGVLCILSCEWSWLLPQTSGLLDGFLFHLILSWQQKRSLWQSQIHSQFQGTKHPLMILYLLWNKYPIPLYSSAHSPYYYHVPMHCWLSLFPSSFTAYNVFSSFEARKEDKKARRGCFPRPTSVSNPSLLHLRPSAVWGGWTPPNYRWDPVIIASTPSPSQTEYDPGSGSGFFI